MTRARLGALAVCALVGFGFGAIPAHAQEPPDRAVYLFLVPGISFEDAMADATLASLATNGGAGLMTLGGGLPTERARGTGPRPEYLLINRLDPAMLGGIDGVATKIEATVTAASADPVLVIVASTRPSSC